MSKKQQPKTITATRQPGQISATGGELSNYLVRQMPVWNNPQWMNSEQWRLFVRKQPIAVLCREAISDHLLSLDWAIIARDSTRQDELKDEITHYTRLLERGNAYYTTLDYTSHIEWIVKDMFDLPFGAASEIGREYDSPDGKVVWIKPLDGGTLAPTLDVDFPVIQHYPAYDPIVLPKEYVSRIYLSPRTEIQREGWGMPPPERIYLAMEMLNRGDVYYAQLLLNTPEAGILDLMDMDKESAMEWVGSFRDLLYGINPLKIPVLYEHTSEAKWIPFGKLPSEIMYDNITNRYITIVCAGYGLTPSDIGFSSQTNGGNSLAGAIRQERQSARSGKALAKKKMQVYFDNILPDTLCFKWKDFDDEKNVAMSRSRLASATAFSSLIDKQIVSPDEARRQMIADGVMTIIIPETLDRKSIEWPSNTLRYTGVKSGNPANDKQIGDPQAASAGGHGGVTAQQIVSRSRPKIEVSLSKAIYASNQILGALINSVKKSNNDFGVWESKFEGTVIGKSRMDLGSETVIDDTYNNIVQSLSSSDWLDTVSIDVTKMAVENYNYVTKEKAQYDLMKRAEKEFIEGTREDILPLDGELQIEEKSVTNELVFETKKLLVENLVPKIILVSEKSIIEHKFDIDTTVTNDHNTIKLARATAEKVYGILPQILGEVENEIEKSLGEK